MKLSISNIAWDKSKDEEMYSLLKSQGYSGLEIAPTRLFEVNPYECIEQAKDFKNKLKIEYGLSVCSMQSIWYGRKEKLFRSENERKDLLEYTKKAIVFAQAIGANNLVFGCPQNRVISSEMDVEKSFDFFYSIGEFAHEHGTIVAMEANPVIYNTNFLNTTKETIEFVEKINSKGLKVNLDMGTMIYNEEDLLTIKDKVELINHVHISEPNLKLIEKRKMHNEFLNLLRQKGYQNYVSIEMGKQEDINNVISIITYIEEISNKEKNYDKK